MDEMTIGTHVVIASCWSTGTRSRWSVLSYYITEAMT